MSQPIPVDVAVSRQRATCQITWSDGLTASVALAELRRACPCATCNEQRQQAAEGGLLVVSGPPPTAELSGLEAIGGYALRFVWADGHSTGLYSYELLRELSERAG